MAELKKNTWTIGEWYDQDVAENIDYQGSGEMWVWGNNENGELGTNNKTDYSSPVQVPGSWGTKGDAGNDFSAAIKSDGTLWMQGKNNYGRLGQNNNTNYSSPRQVGSDTTWATVTCSSDSTYATKTDGTMWGWGRNYYGALGANTTCDWPNNCYFSSPIQVPGTTWSPTYPPTGSGASHNNMTVKTDGTLWAWGQNNYGVLGQNSETKYSSPVKIPGSGWLKPARTKNGATGAIKTDGTLWMWGRNRYGSIGDNTTHNQSKSEPVQVPGTNWKNMACGTYQTIATKTDGTLWIWGDNRNGGLGQNQYGTTHRSSPVQVGSGADWDEVSAGDHFVGATKTDGTMWVWGENDAGHLGQNNLQDYSSPIQIPGTDWHSPPRFGGSAVKAPVLAFKEF